MTKGSFDNAHLVRQSLNGDRSAYDALVREYCGMVRAIALARLDQDPEVADDIVQEVFLRGWLHLNDLSAPERLPAWLCQIARNLSTDWKRRERAKSALVQMVSIAHAEFPASHADDVSAREKLVHNEDLEALRKALKTLPADQRELLLLHFSENLSQSEIARRLGVHPSTIMRKLNAATLRLRRLHDKAVETLPAYRTHEKSVQRTSAVMAAAYVLNTTQRSALALTSSKTLSIAKLSPRNTSILSSFVGQVVAGACLAGAIAVMVVNGISIFEVSWAGSNAGESIDGYSTEVNAKKHDHKSSTLHTQLGTIVSQERPRVVAKGSGGSGGTASNRSSTGSTSVTSSVPNAAQLLKEYVIIEEQPNCISLDQLRKIISSVEEIAGSATYTFNTSQTILGRTAAENFIADRHGTSTLKAGNYEIQHRVVNREGDQASVETIKFDSLTDTVTVTRPGGQPRVFTDVNRHIPANAYDPLKALLRPPYGDSYHLSEFVVDSNTDDIIVTTCTVGSNNSRRIYFGGTDWTIRLDPENSYFPDYFQTTTGPDHRIRMEKTVTKFASINGISYPSEFAIRTYGTDEAGNPSVVNATTASVRMLDIGLRAKGPSNQDINTSAVQHYDPHTSANLSSEVTTQQQQRELEHRSRIRDILKRTR